MSNNFGGHWTEIKLDALRKYIIAYCTVLKNQDFNKVYLDVFAGNGTCNTKTDIIPGSTRIALENGSFNEYIFIEKNPEFANELKLLKDEFPNKKITIICGDCNTTVKSILNKYNWYSTRMLAFIDPFSTQLKYETLQHIASIKAIDSWYLFPFSTFIRCIKKNGDVSESLRKIILNLLGTNEWETGLFKPKPQLNLFDIEEPERVEINDICCFIKKNLSKIFAYVSCPVYLTNTKNAPLFLLFFTMSNPSQAAIEKGQRISSSIINSYSKVCEH